MSRRHVAAFAAAVIVVTVAAVPRAVATPPPPSTVVALGGGASTGADSWSTSTKPAIGSILRRLGSAWGRNFPSGHVTSYTLATSGFTVAGLERQAKVAVARKPTAYATVEVGVRDLCAGTSLQTFRAGLDRGLRILSRPRPTTTTTDSNPILVVSIEDLAREWRVVRASPAGAAMLRAGGQLACGLGYNASPARLAQIRARTTALNEILARVCFQHHFCIYDNGLRFRMPLSTSYFSPSNPARLSVAGARALAALEWAPAKALISVSSG